MDCTIMNERKLKIGALMNVRGSLFEKQALESGTTVSASIKVWNFPKSILLSSLITSLISSIVYPPNTKIKYHTIFILKGQQKNYTYLK